MHNIIIPMGLLAQPSASHWDLLLQHLVAAVVFSLIGIIFFFLSLFMMEKLTKFSITHEVVEEHNVSLAIIVGAIVLGMAIIIAAAVLG